MPTRHDRGGDAVPDYVVGHGKYAGLLERSKAENGLLHFTRCNEHTLAFEAVVGAAHDEDVAVGIDAREIAGHEPAVT
jgi:hypothetical protein